MTERRRQERRKNVGNQVLPEGVTRERRQRERRGGNRLPCAEKILVLGEPVASMTCSAMVMDISDSGVGLLSETPFKVGQAIRFMQRRRATDFPDQGVIMWTMKDAKGYRAGVMFS